MARPLGGLNQARSIAGLPPGYARQLLSGTEQRSSVQPTMAAERTRQMVQQPDTTTPRLLEAGLNYATGNERGAVGGVTKLATDQLGIDQNTGSMIAGAAAGSLSGGVNGAIQGGVNSGIASAAPPGFGGLASAGLNAMKGYSPGALASKAYEFMTTPAGPIAPISVDPGTAGSLNFTNDAPWTSSSGFDGTMSPLAQYGVSALPSDAIGGAVSSGVPDWATWESPINQTAEAGSGIFGNWDASDSALTSGVDSVTNPVVQGLADMAMPGFDGVGSFDTGGFPVVGTVMALSDGQITAKEVGSVGGGYAGAQIGAAFGPVGAVVGGVLGSVLGGGGRVICTELYRTGLLSRELYVMDLRFTEKHLSPATVQGYHIWAIPYVRLMRRSPLAVKIMLPIAASRAQEIGHIMKPEKYAPSLLGKLVRMTWEPICWVLGKLFGPQDYSVLYTKEEN